MNRSSAGITITALSGLVSTLLPLPARAEQPISAAESFRAGVSAHSRKDYRAAAVFFESANELVPSAAALYNAGMSWDHAGEAARAADDLEAAFVSPGELDEDQRADSLARLWRLRRSLGKLVLTGDAHARVSVAHAKGRTAPGKVFLLPGEHDVGVEVGGQTTFHVVTIEIGRETRLQLEGPKVPPPKRVVVRLVPLPSLPPPPAARQGPVFGAQAGVAVAFGVVALGGVGAAVGLGLAGREKPLPSGLDEADALRSASNVAWFVAGSFAVSSIVLFSTAPWNRNPKRKATWIVAPEVPVHGGLGVVAAGAF